MHDKCRYKKAPHVCYVMDDCSVIACSESLKVTMGASLVMDVMNTGGNRYTYMDLAGGTWTPHDYMYDTK